MYLSLVAARRFFALVLYCRQFELFAQNVRELIQRDFDFDGVLPLVFARLPFAAAGLPLPLRDPVAHFAVTLTNTTFLLVTEDEAWNVYLGDRNGHQILAFAAQNFP